MKANFCKQIFIFYNCYFIWTLNTWFFKKAPDCSSENPLWLTIHGHSIGKLSRTPFISIPIQWNDKFINPFVMLNNSQLKFLKSVLSQINPPLREEMPFALFPSKATSLKTICKFLFTPKKNIKPLVVIFKIYH